MAKRNLITKEVLKTSIAKNLRTARMSFEPKMTQDSIAQLFDPPLTRAAIAQWEVGDTLPDLDRLAVLSQAFGTTIDALVFGEDHNGQEDLTPEAVKVARMWTSLGRKQRGAVVELLASMKPSKTLSQ